MDSDYNFDELTKPGAPIDDDLAGFSFDHVGQDYDDLLLAEPTIHFHDDPVVGEEDFFNNGSLDTNDRARKNAFAIASTRPKIKRDYTDQKKLTQKIRSLIDRDGLMTLTRPITGRKPGQICLGIRRMRMDLNMLSQVNKQIETHVIGKNRLKMTDKKLLSQARSQRNVMDKLFDTKSKTQIPIAPPCFYDLFKVRPPGFDMTSVAGMTVEELEKSDLVNVAKEFMEVYISNRKMETFIESVEKSRDNLVLASKNNDYAQPHEFVEVDDDETETCMRVRPLIRAAKRPIVINPFTVDTSHQSARKFTPRGNTVQDYAICNRDLSSEFSIGMDMFSETIMTKIMHRRAFDHINSIPERIDALAEGSNYDKLHTAKEVEASSSGLVRTEEVVPKAVQNDMKMVFKRVVPQKGLKSSLHYEVAKKQEAVIPIVKPLCPTNLKKPKKITGRIQPNIKKGKSAYRRRH